VEFVDTSMDAVKGGTMEPWVKDEYLHAPVVVKLTDTINHPPHYNMGKFECIDVIEDWNLGYRLGCAVKYIARCNHKGSKVEDLKKAIWYLQREIDKS
jgi:hypothetical protein